MRTVHDLRHQQYDHRKKQERRIFTQKLKLLCKFSNGLFKPQKILFHMNPERTRKNEERRSEKRKERQKKRRNEAQKLFYELLKKMFPPQSSGEKKTLYKERERAQKKWAIVHINIQCSSKRPKKEIKNSLNKENE